MTRLTPILTPILTLCAALALSACTTSPTAPSTPATTLATALEDARASKSCAGFSLSLAASRWAVDLFPNQPFTNLADGSLAQTFTTSNAPGDVGYGHTTPPCTNLTGKVISLTAKLIGLGTLVPYDWPSDPGPVMIRPQFFAYAVDFSDPNRRWWSTTGTTLSTTPQTILVPINDPAQWSQVNGVNGASEPTVFADAAAHAVRLGWTVGSAMFYGHGGYVTNNVPTQLVIVAESAN